MEVVNNDRKDMLQILKAYFSEHPLQSAPLLAAIKRDVVLNVITKQWEYACKVNGKDFVHSPVIDAIVDNWCMHNNGKGIILTGDTGVGKSTFLRDVFPAYLEWYVSTMIEPFPKFSIHNLPTIYKQKEVLNEFCSLCKEDVLCFNKPIYVDLKSMSNAISLGYDKGESKKVLAECHEPINKVICIDEVGAELPRLFGEPNTIFDTLVDVAEKQHKLLVIATNLNASMLRDRYDKRTIDRLHGIIGEDHFISFGNEKSHRG